MIFLISASEWLVLQVCITSAWQKIELLTHNLPQTAQKLNPLSTISNPGSQPAVGKTCKKLDCNL
jgi:hypothetical protein